MLRPVLVFATAIAVAALPACATRTPAAPGRLSTRIVVAGDVAWPARPDEPTPLNVVEGEEYGSLVDQGRRGEGLLYQLRLQMTRIAIDGRFSIGIGAHDKVWYTISGPAGEVPDDEAHPLAPWSAWPFLFSTEATRMMELGGPDGEVYCVEVHAVSPDLTLLYFSVPRAQPIRGTVLMLASLDGMTAGEQAVLKELKDRGWVVIWTAPSLSQLRAPFFLRPDGDANELVDEFASRINHNVSERAYALEAALDYLHEKMPELEDSPLTAIGCSAGAISLPTVAARLSRPVDAAVLVGGGCDLFQIVTRSDLFRDRVEIIVDLRQITPQELEALQGPILERARLDPYHTAATLRDTPVLMLHGSYDRIVPADRGDLLYERLGRPERWVYPVGHLGLFFILPMQARAVVDWMEAQVADTSTK